MPMMSVAPMAVMHEDVHERACQQKQKWQRPDDVRQVLCQQKVCGHTTNHNQPDGIA